MLQKKVTLPYLHSPKARLCTAGKCKSLWPLQVNSWQDWSIQNMVQKRYMEMQSPFKPLLQIQEINYSKIQITSFNFQQQNHFYPVIKSHLDTCELLAWNIVCLVVLTAFQRSVRNGSSLKFWIFDSYFQTVYSWFIHLSTSLESIPARELFSELKFLISFLFSLQLLN